MSHFSFPRHSLPQVNVCFPRLERLLHVSDRFLRHNLFAHCSNSNVQISFFLADPVHGHYTCSLFFLLFLVNTTRSWLHARKRSSRRREKEMINSRYPRGNVEKSPRISCTLRYSLSLRKKKREAWSFNPEEILRTAVFSKELSDGLSHVAHHHFDITADVNDRIVMEDQVR